MQPTQHACHRLGERWRLACVREGVAEVGVPVEQHHAPEPAPRRPLPSPLRRSPVASTRVVKKRG